MTEKKKKNSKENLKKGKSTSKKAKKEVVVQEEKKKDWKEFFQSTPFLLSVFIGLIILIVILGVCIYKNEKKKEEEFDAHITIPVLKVSSNFEFGVDASLLVDEKNREYIFKITNYRNEDKAKEEIPYQVVIENTTNSIITLTKGDSTDNLIQEQEETVLEEVMPFSEENEEVYYHLRIDSFEDLKMDDFIQIKIIS